jgi:hypothetical protein
VFGWLHMARPPKPQHVVVSFDGPLVIEQKPPPAPPPVRCVVTAKLDGFSVRGDAPMTYKLPDDKKIVVRVEYLDAKGRPASVDGDVEWTTSDDMIANVGVLQGDSQQAEIVPGQNLGQCQITATADADLGEGTKEVICTLDVEVVGGEAVIGTITPVGEPQPIDPAHPDQGLPGAPTATPHSRHR